MVKECEDEQTRQRVKDESRGTSDSTSTAIDYTTVTNYRRKRKVGEKVDEAGECEYFYRSESSGARSCQRGGSTHPPSDVSSTFPLEE